MNTESYWLSTVERAPEYRTDKIPARADVVVVGGGITGISAAYHLRRKGLGVVVLERGRIGRGATSWSTGMLTAEPGDDYTLVLGRGKEHALRMRAALIGSIEEIGRLIEEEAIDCGFARVPALYLSHARKTDHALAEEAAALKQLGIASTMLNVACVRRQYPWVGEAPALRTDDHGKINPYRFVLGLAEATIRLGGTIAEGTTYLSHQEKANGVVVHTDQGPILARRLMLCSDNDTGSFMPASEPIISITETVIVTEPVPALQAGYPELFWNAFNLFEYFRVVDGRLMVGSGLTARLNGDADGPIIDRALEQVFGLLDLGRPTIDYRWNGSFAVTDDHEPYLVAVSEHVSVCGGYNGHGLVLGFMAGRVLSERAVGESGAHADIFRSRHHENTLVKLLFRLAPPSFRRVAERMELIRLRIVDKNLRGK